MPRIASPASHIDAAFLGKAIVLLIDADDFRLEEIIHVGPQAHEGTLAHCQASGQSFIDIRSYPDGVGRDQCEHSLARVRDTAEFPAAGNNSGVERSPKFVLGKHDRVELTLGRGIFLQHGGNLGIGLDNPGIAESNFFRGLGILGSLKVASGPLAGLPVLAETRYAAELYALKSKRTARDRKAYYLSQLLTAEPALMDRGFHLNRGPFTL